MNKEKSMSMLLKFSLEIEKEGTLPRSFYESSIIFITNLDAQQKKELQTNLFNIAKIHNKTLTNQIQQYIKKIIHYDQIGFILESKYGSTYKSVNAI
jgi:hypothetical protein